MMCYGVRHASGMRGGRRWGTCFARFDQVQKFGR
jgi:hypothetical protein